MTQSSGTARPPAAAPIERKGGVNGSLGERNGGVNDAEG